MCQHEIKNCPRCKVLFECKPGTITQCQCYGIVITDELKAYMHDRYNDCLCRDCLVYLQQSLPRNAGNSTCLKKSISSNN